MSVCAFDRKKRQKKRFVTGKYNMFWKRPDFLEVSVSSFADRHRVFDQKVQKTTKKVGFLKLVYECMALFPRDLLRKRTHTLIH